MTALCWRDRALPAVGKSQENVEERGAGVVIGLLVIERDAEGLLGWWADKLLGTGGKEGRLEAPDRKEESESLRRGMEESLMSGSLGSVVLWSRSVEKKD